MQKLIEKLKALSTSISLEHEYNWKIPESSPIPIPRGQSNYHQNIYLKDNLRDSLLNDPDMTNHYCVIQQWGGIRTFKSTKKNDQKLGQLKEQLDKGRLKGPIFESISSLSKVASFLEPEKYSIYDSRAIYALNWLLFCYSDQTELYPQPAGRNSQLAKYDIPTIVRLYNEDHSYKSTKTAYHDYCRLLIQLSEEIYGDMNPHKMEMLLFVAAPKQIIGDIQSTVNITMNIA